MRTLDKLNAHSLRFSAASPWSFPSKVGGRIGPTERAEFADLTHSDTDDLAAFSYVEVRDHCLMVDEVDGNKCDCTISATQTVIGWKHIPVSWKQGE